MENKLSIVYAEVCEILSFMEPKYVDKIPKKLLNLFYEESEKDYKISINPNIPLTNQNLQRKTLALLAMLNLHYWCESETEKQELLRLYENNDKKREEELDKLREKYDPDDLFKKEEQVIVENEVKQENTQLIEYEEKNIFKKIINKIMKFFKRNY